MGIRGLTTFIENRSHLYLEDYELHDTNIVLDGYAIACQLYKWHCKSNDCFGGDYDKYAAVIETFFDTLFRCNVTPYIVFDGGYETRKMATVISRMKNKIKSAEQLSSVTEGSISVFPLFLSNTFEDIALKLHVKCVRCDFEGDTEVANIAKILNCPVLSYDSDFFIFDVLYIPFSTFELSTRKKKKIPTGESYSYIGCKLYRVEKFLKSFGGLDKRNLPILAVLLGNDYINRGVFTMFYRNLKIQKCHGNQNDQQKRIKSVIIWLQNESTESAVQKILSRYKCKRRQVIVQKIQNAIKGYHCTNSIYLKYLGIAPIAPKETVDFSVDINYEDNENVEDEELDDSEDNIVSDSEGEQSSVNEDPDDCFDEDACENDERNLAIDLIFLEKFRYCLYPPSFMDILVQNKYYCIPQIDDGSQQHSHAVSSDILRAIHRILRNSEDNLVCVARDTTGHVKNHPLPYCDINMPSLSEVQNMDQSSRQLLLLQILNFDNDFLKNCVNLFPSSWHLFIIAIKYLIDKSVVTWPIVYAIILCKIFLEYVDKHVGHCRSLKTLEKMTENKCPILGNKDTDEFLKDTITEALKDIKYNDSVVCLKILLPYFHINLKMKTSNRLFDRNILHSMAQFQSCLLHLKYLNNLLNSPFANCVISEIFNGTLIYNLSQNFIKRSNLDNYVALLLQDTRTVFNSVKLIIDKVKEHGNCVKCNDPPKRRKKKTKSKVVDDTVDKGNPSEEETCPDLDPNNKYSVLMFAEKNC